MTFVQKLLDLNGTVHLKKVSLNSKTQSKNVIRVSVIISNVIQTNYAKNIK